MPSAHWRGLMTIKKRKPIRKFFTEKYLELAGLFSGETLSEETHPVNFKLIQREQVCDTKLVDHAAKTND